MPNLNRRLSPKLGLPRSCRHGWERGAEGGYGYLLEDDGTIVGVQLVFSSRRDLGSGATTLRDLGALVFWPDIAANPCDCYI
jgi:hypothetical protein